MGPFELPVASAQRTPLDDEHAIGSELLDSVVAHHGEDVYSAKVWVSFTARLESPNLRLQTHCLTSTETLPLFGTANSRHWAR